MLLGKSAGGLSKNGLKINYKCPMRFWETKYQRAVKLAKSNYLSDIISKNSHNSKVFFTTITSVLHPIALTSISPLRWISEQFLKFFTGKIPDTRSWILSVSNDPVIFSVPLNLLTCFAPVSLSQLKHTIAHMKLNGSSCDVIPSTLFKEVVDSICPSVLSIVNSSLSTGIDPSGFKHAII